MLWVVSFQVRVERNIGLRRDEVVLAVWSIGQEHAVGLVEQLISGLENFNESHNQSEFLEIPTSNNPPTAAVEQMCSMFMLRTTST